LAKLHHERQGPGVALKQFHYSFTVNQYRRARGDRNYADSERQPPP
jgi:hypothetical protein